MSAFVNRPNDCILEPIPWMDDPEEMLCQAARRLRYIDTGGSTPNGQWYTFPATGKVFCFSRTQHFPGSVISQTLQVCVQSYAAKTNLRVLREASRAEVINAIKQTSGVSYSPTLERGYWYEVHGD